MTSTMSFQLNKNFHIDLGIPEGKISHHIFDDCNQMAVFYEVTGWYVTLTLE